MSVGHLQTLSLLGAAAATPLLGFRRPADSRLAWPLFCSLANQALGVAVVLVRAQKPQLLAFFQARGRLA
ncbi:hypothetical protein DEO72_LG11g2829 [Vigna unguiculata]|uniref:Uncharacterized protein n=1 Tax=Vigna unguiculata TaxID=3917 RepID=A0A4D6NVJ1_VIGUN|nr:hypothetical protein DEO72_LG11g2829 [Vigna unguiculata]